jgi:hypothetical protein
LWNKVFNATFRLVTDPIIDGDAGFFCLRYEVQYSQAGTVVLGQDIEEGGQEFIVLLPPDGVNNVYPFPSLP